MKYKIVFTVSQSTCRYSAKELVEELLQPIDIHQREAIFSSIIPYRGWKENRLVPVHIGKQTKMAATSTRSILEEPVSVDLTNLSAFQWLLPCCEWCCPVSMMMVVLIPCASQVDESTGSPWLLRHSCPVSPTGSSWWRCWGSIFDLCTE